MRYEEYKFLGAQQRKIMCTRWDTTGSGKKGYQRFQEINFYALDHFIMGRAVDDNYN